MNENEKSLLTSTQIIQTQEDNINKAKKYIENAEYITSKIKEAKRNLNALFDLHKKNNLEILHTNIDGMVADLIALGRELRPDFIDLKWDAFEGFRKTLRKIMEDSPAKAQDYIRTALAIVPFRGSLASNTVDECKNLHGLQAETNCTFFVDIRAAVEFIGDNDFSDSFERLELRTRFFLAEFNRDLEKIEKTFEDRFEESETDWVARFHVLLNAALTSRNTDRITPGKLTSEKVVEGRLGLQIDFLDFYRKEDGKAVPTHTLAFLGEGGFFDPTNDPNDDFTKLTANHFAGLRLYYRGKSRFNGATIDAGWGESKFFENQEPRLKVRTYIPYRVLDETSGSNFKVFGAIEADIGKGRDELKLIMGVSLPIDQVAKGIGAIFSGGN